MIFKVFGPKMDPYQQIEEAQQGYFVFPVSGAWVGRPKWVPRNSIETDVVNLPPEKFANLHKIDDGLFHMLWRLHWLWLQMGAIALQNADAGAIQASAAMPTTPPMGHFGPPIEPAMGPKPAASQPPPMGAGTSTPAASQPPKPRCAPSTPTVVPPRGDMPPPPAPKKRKKRPRSPDHSPPRHLKEGKWMQQQDFDSMPVKSTRKKLAG
jgi:hypothetical protein